MVHFRALHENEPPLSRSRASEASAWLSNYQNFMYGFKTNNYQLFTYESSKIWRLVRREARPHTRHCCHSKKISRTWRQIYRHFLRIWGCYGQFARHGG
ncbi:MAG: hypothetical protein U5L45_09090 [Saprospiraceae bacterium]|nr:hypothetical protein [Saprospiraceae bacterium]